MTTVAAVFNPGSARTDEAVRSEVLETLGRLGEVRLVQPRSEESFHDDVIAGTADADIIVSAGGDGTLSLIVDALEARLAELTFAVVPLGTGNDFARTLGVPSDPVEAAASLTSAKARAIDVGRASDGRVRRLFVNGCLGGFPVRANQAIDSDTKRKLGPLAFVVGGVKALGDLHRSSVVVDGRRIADCIAIGVGNGRTVGGGIEMWPSARPDDGLLDVCVLSAGSIAEAVVLAGKTRIGSHEDSDGAVIVSGRTFTIEADPTMEFNVDGELVGLRTPATFELVSTCSFLEPPH